MKLNNIFFVVVLSATTIAVGVNIIQKQTNNTKASIHVLPVKGRSYNDVKRNAGKIRLQTSAAVNSGKIKYDSAEKIFTRIIRDSIIPYWYGTVWDFNGYTAVPQQGTVACGYFVSTTLQHSDLKLNRYKMAQKSAMDGALMLEKKDSLYIKQCSRDAFLPAFKQTHRNGLYMVGLSNHVGYLYKQDSLVQFIHSSYISPGTVVAEDAATSVALGYSKVFVVADITYNRPLLRKWLKGETIPH